MILRCNEIKPKFRRMTNEINTRPAAQRGQYTLGGIDQISNNTDLLDEIERCKKLRILYNEAGRDEGSII